MKKIDFDLNGGYEIINDEEPLSHIEDINEKTESNNRTGSNLCFKTGQNTGIRIRKICISGGESF